MFATQGATSCEGPSYDVFAIDPTSAAPWSSAHSRGTAAPHFVFSPCRPPHDQQWTGDRLVTICPADYWVRIEK